MINWKSPFFIITITIIFIWFCLVGEFGFAQQSDKSPLLMARMLAEEGDYIDAIKILNDYINEIKDKKSENQNLNEAYYLFAKIYYMVGEDELCDKNLKQIYINNPEFQKEEADFAFKERLEEVKKRILIEAEVEVKAKDEEIKPIKKVIPKISKKKSKKKFPWLLAIGGVVVVGMILYFLLKKTDTE